jgi:GTPase
MAAVITIVGRPNVGKSTLFNYLTNTRQALVADWPGVTRDRQYGAGEVGDQAYWVVDTGGLAEPEDPSMAELTDRQVMAALEEADRVFFLVDGEQGLTVPDRVIAQQLRQKYKNKLYLVVNKVDRHNADELMAEFYELGLPHVYAISAKSGRGIKALVSVALHDIPPTEIDIQAMPGIRVAIVGRPNVGKSTLTNCLLGEDRVVVYDSPGTTRDSVAIPYTREGQEYTLIDTAGVRRRSKVKASIETYSVIKTLKSIEMAQVVLMVIDAREGVTDQDLRLIGRILHYGKAILLVFNKWDKMSAEDRKDFTQNADRKLKFIDFAARYTISALHGTGVGHLYKAIHRAHSAVVKDLSTPDLTRALIMAQESHQPPMIGNRRIKLRYAHVGSRNPLSVVIHGKQLNKLPGSYKTYLSKFFREHFQLHSLPVIISLRNDDNPYV